jgi:phospholipid transport system substrate-binding protein
MNRKLGTSVVALATLVALGLAPARADKQSPEDVIRSTAAKVIEVLADKGRSTDQKKTTLDGYLDTCCDFETISKLVMAKNWRSLSGEQQKEFVTLFRQYLVATYGDNIENYKGETVDILSGRKEARDDYTVMTKIDRGSADADLLVDYRLRLAPGGEWKIIDVIAEGISMVSNLRSQFQEVVSQKGADELLRRLRDKTLPKATTTGT